MIVCDDNSGTGNNAQLAYGRGLWQRQLPWRNLRCRTSTDLYQLSVTEIQPDNIIGNATTTAAIALGQTVFSMPTGRDEARQNDVDWFGVQLTAGVVYDFSLAGATQERLTGIDSAHLQVMGYNTSFNAY